MHQFLVLVRLFFVLSLLGVTSRAEPPARQTPKQPAAVTPSLSPTPTRHTITSREIALGVGKLLLSGSFEKDGHALDRRVCAGMNGCNTEEKAGLPALAWRVLAISRLVAISNEPQLNEGLVRSFSALKEATNNNLIGDEAFRYPESFEEIFSIHQAYEAYLINGDQSYLEYFTTGILKAEEYLKLRNGAAEEERGSMLIATLARELGLAAGATARPDMVKALQSASKAFTSRTAPQDLSKWKTALLEKAESQLSLADKLARSDAGSDSKTLPGPEYDGCFLIWARQAISQAGGGAGRASGSSPYEQEIDKYFERYFPGGHRKGPQLMSPQMILPCIHVAQERAESRTKYKDLAHAIEEELVRSFWDDPRNPICEGNGGFFSSSSFNLIDGEKRSTRCQGNAFLTADNSWSAFLLGRSQGSFLVGD